MQFRRQLIPPVIAGLIVMLALLGLIGTAIRDPRPHDIPVGLVGPPAAVQQVTTAFATNAPGAFAFTSYGLAWWSCSRSLPGWPAWAPPPGSQATTAPASGARRPSPSSHRPPSVR